VVTKALCFHVGGVSGVGVEIGGGGNVVLRIVFCIAFHCFQRVLFDGVFVCLWGGAVPHGAMLECGLLFPEGNPFESC